MNGEEVEDSDLVTFIWCVPEVIHRKEMGKLDYSSGMHKVCKRLFERKYSVFYIHVNRTAKGKVHVR